MLGISLCGHLMLIHFQNHLIYCYRKVGSILLHTVIVSLALPADVFESYVIICPLFFLTCYNFKNIFKLLYFIIIDLNHIVLFLCSSDTLIISPLLPKMPPRFCQLSLYFYITKLVVFISCL